MVKIKIDNKEYEVKDGKYVIDVALQNGIKIPHYCYHPALSRPANCRICLVEVENAPKLIPSCILEVSDGMSIHTNSPKVKEAREQVMEYMLLNHPIDCPICDKAGECLLQDFYFEYNANLRRAAKERVKKRKVIDIGPTIILDSERCILCTRCVRFMDEIVKSPSLGIINKGAYSELTVFDTYKFDNVYSLNTVDLCPVGALTSKDFRFQQRVWFLDKVNSICNLCATGCNTIIEYKSNKIYRITPRVNKEVNSYFMCDYGRLYYKKIQENILPYSVINGKITNNKLEISEFLQTLQKVKKLLLVIGQNMTMEELFAVYLLTKNDNINYYVHYQITNRGFLNTTFSDNFLIDQDKNPNTKGLKMVVDKLPEKVKLNEEAILNNDFDNVLILDEFFYIRFNQQFLTDFTKKFQNRTIYFSSLKNEYTAKFKNVIKVPSIYFKSGSFINRNNLLQFFEGIPSDTNTLTLLEVFNLIGLEKIQPEYIWQKIKIDFPHLKNTNFNLRHACSTFHI